MKSKFIGIILMVGVIVFTIKCNAKKQSKLKENTMQIIEIDKQTDWGGNFKLNIQSIETIDSVTIYKIISLSNNGLPVGFELQVPTKMDSFGKGVEFRTIGNPSDNFIKTLYEIYGLEESSDLKFVKTISCNYASLNDIEFKGDGQKRLKTVNYIKVFFEGNGEYAELYLNIDETSKKIEFEEKDFEYRPYVAMFLSEE